MVSIFHAMNLMEIYMYIRMYPWILSAQVVNQPAFQLIRASGYKQGLFQGKIPFFWPKGRRNKRMGSASMTHPLRGHSINCKVIFFLDKKRIKSPTLLSAAGGFLAACSGSTSRSNSFQLFN